MNYRRISVANNRTSINSLYSKIAFMSCLEKGDDCIETNTSILRGATKDIFFPFPKMSSSSAKPFAQSIIMRTHSKSSEPTIESEYCHIIGHLIEGTVRYTIIYVKDESPSDFAISVG